MFNSIYLYWEFICISLEKCDSLMAELAFADADVKTADLLRRSWAYSKRWNALLFLFSIPFFTSPTHCSGIMAREIKKEPRDF